MKDFISESVDKTQLFATELAKRTKEGTVIALLGGLGAGKTTFAQGFAKGLGIKSSVISPTFKLVSEYSGNMNLYHIDCYRLESSLDFLNIGGEDYLNPVGGVTLIEWPERIKDLWTNNWLLIYFQRIEEEPNKRKIRLKSNQV